jgi:hypothetical protein
MSMPDWINALPPQIYWPTLVLTAVTYFWPQIFRIWRDLLPRHRQHRSERTRLELLKLWYEVEAARKAAGVEEADNLPDYLRPPPEDSTESVSESPASIDELPKRSRILWGVAGALAISLLTFVAADLPLHFTGEFDIYVAAGVATRYGLFVAIAVGLALFIRTKDAKSAFIVGMVPALLLQALILISMWMSGVSVDEIRMS